MSKQFAAAVVLLLAVCTATLFGKPVPDDRKPVEKQADYYPLQVGTQWHYQMEVNGQMGKVVSQIAKIEKIAGRSLARLEVVVDGKQAAVAEHLAASPQGVFRHRANGLEVDPALCLLKYPIKEGETWQTKSKVGAQMLVMESKVGAWQQLEVPAGKFKVIPVRVKVEEGGQTVISDYWFAAGVGVVQQSVELGGLKISLKLEKFVPGAK